LIIFEFREVHAFCVLTYIVNDIMEGYHSRSLIRIMADMSVLETLIAQRFPHVHQQFKTFHGKYYISFRF